MSPRSRAGRPSRAWRPRRQDERGGILILLMIGVAIASIGLGVATQAWSKTWRRDNEEELIFRGEQYVDAILAYRKEHGGQFPTNLDDLFKPGPRRLRYIRKLFRDPISADGRWGLLYLMPGGQGVFDPVAAQKAKGAAGEAGEGDEGDEGGEGVPGFTQFDTDPTGSGVPGARGAMPGALPPGLPPPPPLPSAAWGATSFDDDAISETPIGWPVVGVVSRATGKRNDETFRIYKGHERVSEWQFHVFDRGLQLQQAPTAVPVQPRGPGFIGPGFGGRGSIGGISDGGRQIKTGGPGDRGGLWPNPGGGAGQPPPGKPPPDDSGVPER